MTAQRYTLPAMLLHWVQAAVVLWLLWLGWNMVDLPKGAERSAAYSLHKSLGLLALMLILQRCRLDLPQPLPLAFEWGASLRRRGGQRIRVRAL